MLARFLAACSLVAVVVLVVPRASPSGRAPRTKSDPVVGEPEPEEDRTPPPEPRKPVVEDGWERFRTETQDIGTVEATLAYAANDGMPLGELRDQWRAAAKRTGHPRAREMAAHYQSLMAANPSRLTAMEALVFSLHEWSGAHEPVSALREAGWDALPALIRFRDDPRPTRKCGDLYFVSVPRESTLLTIGEACECLIYDILHAVPEGDVAASLRAGPRAHYESLLDCEDPSIAFRALGRLYTLSPDEYGEIAFERLRGNRQGQREFLLVAGCELAAREPALLESWLTGAPDDVLELAAVLLYDAHRSVVAVRALLDRFARKPDRVCLLWLTQFEHEELEAGIGTLLASGSTGARTAILEHDWPKLGAAFDDAVRALLHDPAVTELRWVRICDLAAYRLIQRRGGEATHPREIVLLEPRDEIVARERAR